MNVSATPIPVARANSRSAGAAPTRMTPLPASTTGLIAPRMISAALSSSCALGSGRRSVVRAGSGSASTVAAMTSSGSSRWVGPGFCACATLKALRTVSGMIRGRVIQERVGDRGDQVRGARPERAEADAGALGEPPVHVGHVRTALLVADGDEGDARALQRLVEIQGLLARNAEYVLDALGLEALDEEIRRLAFAHPATSIPAMCRANVRDRSRRRFPMMHRFSWLILALLGCL